MRKVAIKIDYDTRAGNYFPVQSMGMFTKHQLANFGNADANAVTAMLNEEWPGELTITYTKRAAKQIKIDQAKPSD